MKRIAPSVISGSIRVIPSKSISHRALICAALAPGSTSLRNIAFSEDISATAQALRAMGLCHYDIEGDSCIVSGGLHSESAEVIDCGESGSTLRFLLPLALDGKKHTFTGHGRLLRRPMDGYDKIFVRNHVRFDKNEERIEICGELAGGEYELPGDVSSQFVSGLLFKLPMLFDDSGLHITTEPESKPYIDITQDVQSRFRVNSRWSGNNIEISGRQGYVPCDMEIEGDYSHAAFFAAAAAITGSVRLKGLCLDSKQGDKAIIGLLRCMGAEITENEDEIIIEKGALKPIEADVSQIPDLVPVLAVLGCAAQGKTRIYNAGRLRYKESDRLHSITTELEKLG
ncbi:MAG: 3-phosphoshikimate 1-carboxyvinyltransferase, partial [Christensenella sp.]|uniref:3-phosphoshikimate 1-carboxyvinyltransferase n=1 Tax=Christensenella sp. TaxID=1935934 RepID=UPI002B21EF14